MQMKSMIKRLEGYLREKNLEINARKTKIVLQRKRKGQQKEMDVKGRENRGSKGVQILGVRATKERGAKMANEKSGQKSGSNGSGMGDRKEEV